MTTGFVSQFPGAFALGQAIFELAQGCYAADALSLIASGVSGEEAYGDAGAGGVKAKLNRLDGTSISYLLPHYLSLATDHPSIKEHVSKAWYAGALITAGDMLAAHAYFDRQPEFELVYHLRNAAAHGNRFNITQAGANRLKSHPAHLRWIFDDSKRFEIKPSLSGQPLLFDFIMPGDVADILTYTAERLRHLEKGILGPGVYTSIFG
ncbi:hypothetical protein [Sphingosinicella sp. BN140058]|uniref:hypothetical protein n=1 Tax=Sphingosinicella sp. BN140058 TaxID=1892855 RepID=UPI001012D419|nr:hypothetical protein [Sphingosinicella sp. BN140058]QAY77259.1 hypothetical protein ETR14_12665 [Sphingosinicella sp. BN140058]